MVFMNSIRKIYPTVPKTVPYGDCDDELEGHMNSV